MRQRILFLMFCLSVFLSPLYAETIQSNSYHFFFNTPSTWNVSQDSNQRVYTLLENSGQSSITVEAFYHDNYQSLQELKQTRSLAFFDGWMVKYERNGTPLEKKSANVKEHALAVYSRYETDRFLKMREFIVGEYYFVTGNYSYVIAVHTPTEAWSSIQSALRKVVSSFSYGNYVEPHFEANSIVDSYRYGWECIGGRPDNTSVSDSGIKSGSVLQVYWSHFLAKGMVFSDNNRPIVYSGKAFVFDGSILHAYKVGDGSKLWSYTVSGGLTCPLVVSNGILYVSRFSGSGSVVSAISADSGMVLFTILFEQPVGSLRVNSGTLFVLDAVGIGSYDAVTGLLVQKKTHPIQFGMYPVVSTQSVFLSGPSGLHCLYLKSLDKRWVFNAVGSSFLEPSVSKQAVIFAHQNLKQAWQLTALNSTSGAVIWEFSTPDLKRVYSPLCMDSEKVYFVGSDKEGKLFLYGLSALTGSQSWKVALKASSETLKLCLASLPESLLCNSQDSVVAFSKQDGSVLPLYFLAKTIEKETLLSYCVEDLTVLKLVERKSGVYLECSY